MKQNFEQDKSVSYSLLASRFVIPWKVEDESTVHAEIITPSEDTFIGLIPEEDFTIDKDDGWLNLEQDFPEAKGGIIHIYEGEKKLIPQLIQPLKREIKSFTAEVAKAEDLEKLKTEKAAKAEVERLEAEVVKKEDFERFKAKAVEKEDLGNLVTTDAMKAYLGEHSSNIDAENNILKTQLKDLENRIKALEPLKDKFSSSGDLVLRVTEQNKTPGISFVGQDGKDIAYMFVRGGDLLIGRDDGAGKLSPCIKLTPDGFKVDGRSVQEHIRGEKDPRYGELIHSELVTKVGDIYNGSQIWHWIYGEGITPPLTPEERLKKWRVIRNHAGTGKHCRGAFIEHND